MTAESGKPYLAVIVVCGCESACAKTDDLAVPERKLLRMGEWKDILNIRDQILGCRHPGQ